MKWEPIAAMLAVLALGIWLALGPSWRPGIKEPPGTTHTLELRVGDTRGALAIIRKPDTPPTFKFLYRDGTAGAELSKGQLIDVLGEQAVQQLIDTRPNWLYRVLNITNPASFWWILLGLGAQTVFSARFLIQWMVSERRKQTVIPEAFWWISLVGGLGLFIYFVWRQDIVGVIGQSSGLVIYARNIRLIHKKRRRDAKTAPAVESDSTNPAQPQGTSEQARPFPEAVPPADEPAQPATDASRP